MVKNIYFSFGGITGMIEHFGKIKYLLRAGICDTTTDIYGCSAGSFAGLLLFLGIRGMVDIDDVQNKCLALYNSNLGLRLCAIQILRYVIDTYCSNVVFDDRLHIGISKMDGFVFVKPIDDIFECLMSSINIPVIIGYNGYGLDGGLMISGAQHLPENTLILNTTFWFPISLIMPITETIVRILNNYGHEDTQRDIVYHNTYKKSKNNAHQELHLTDFQLGLLFSIHQLYSGTIANEQIR